MSFVSLTFVVFYLSVLIGRLTLGRDSRSRLYLCFLIGASLFFYGWHEPAYLALILMSVLTDYFAAIFITRRRVMSESPVLVLVLSLAINLGLLAFFKYAGFITEAIVSLGVVSVSEDIQVGIADILLPVGISFYTFQSMSYSIDVYRGQLPGERRFDRVLLYVAFFPQLVAGPIIRAGQFFYQLDRNRPPRLKVFLEGAYLIVRGLFFKLVIADNIGRVIDLHWKNGADPDSSNALMIYLAVLFSCQIFADFRGYTDIARGIAYQLGFRLPVNFRAPYIAATFSEFWRRWHITLSEWMRDYIYIALGGSRRGLLLTLVNLILVMTISGLWHGAAMNFLLWGFIHGIAIALERSLRIAPGANWIFLWAIVVQLTWIVGMAVFRSTSGEESLIVLANIFSGVSYLGDTRIADFQHLSLALWLTIPVWLSHARYLAVEQGWLPEMHRSEKLMLTGAMLYGIATLYPTTLGFIYFQF